MILQAVAIRELPMVKLTPNPDKRGSRTRTIFGIVKVNGKTRVTVPDNWIESAVRWLIRIVVIAGTAAGAGGIIREMMK